MDSLGLIFNFYNMVFLNEQIEYKKKAGKIYQIITKEIDPNSITDELRELNNSKAEKDAKIKELNDLKNLI